uniref:Uncharacterized protein n=1 Tax=Arundo donax TaxID=35708 RepID=A0A0A9DLW4_ARUDO
MVIQFKSRLCYSGTFRNHTTINSRVTCHKPRNIGLLNNYVYKTSDILKYNLKNMIPKIMLESSCIDSSAELHGTGPRLKQINTYNIRIIHLVLPFYVFIFFSNTQESCVSLY